jgi:hypothetical protein
MGVAIEGATSFSSPKGKESDISNSTAPVTIGDVNVNGLGCFFCLKRKEFGVWYGGAGGRGVTV